MPRFSASSAYVAALGILVTVLCGYPLGNLVWQDVHSPHSLETWESLLREPAAWTALRHTVLSSVGAALLSVFWGGGLAILFTRTRIPGKAIFRSLLFGLLVLPPFVTGLAFLAAYGPGGLVAQIWQFITGQLPALNGIYGGISLTWLLALHGMPLAFLVVQPALAGRSQILEEAAHIGGMGRVHTFLRITIPLLMPALGASALLIFTTSASEYGIAALIGLPGRYQTLTTLVMEKLTFGAGAHSFLEATDLSLMLGILGLLALSVPYARRHPWSETMTAVAGKFEFGCIGTGISSVLFAFFALGLLIPLAALILVALSRAYGLPPIPSNLTFAHFWDLFRDPNVGSALSTSLYLATATSLGVVLLGLPLALWAKRGRLSRLFAILGSLPYTLPGSTFALAAILTWDRPLPLIGSIYETPALLLVTYLGRFLLFGILTSQLAWTMLGEQRREAALVAGTSGMGLVRWLLLPLGGGTLLAGMLWVFITVLHELTISTLLYAPGTETVGVLVMQLNQAGEPTETAALAAMLVLASAALGITAHRLSQPRRREGIGHIRRFYRWPSFHHQLLTHSPTDKH